MTQVGQAKVYKTQGATAQVIASGGTIDVAGGHINAASGRFTQPPSLAKGYIDLGPYLMGARELSSAENFIAGTSAESGFWGGIMMQGATAATPQMSLTATGDQSFYLNWASAVVDGIKLPPIAMPGDMSTAGGVTVNLFGENIGSATAADAKMAFDVRCWMDIGDTEMGSTHPNFTTSPGYKSVTLASGDVSTGILNITLVPEAHAGRTIRLYGGRIDYTKKTS